MFISGPGSLLYKLLKDYWITVFGDAMLGSFIHRYQCFEEPAASIFIAEK
jgi:hypothetical protein